MDGWWWDGELLEAFRIVPAGMVGMVLERFLAGPCNFVLLTNTADYPRHSSLITICHRSDDANYKS